MKLIELIIIPFGLFLLKILPRKKILDLSCVDFPRKISLAKIVQFVILHQDLLHLIEPKKKKEINPDNIDSDFVDLYKKNNLENEFRKTGIYHTDGLLIWSLIEKYKPKIMVETGTGRGISSQIIVKGLNFFSEGSKLVTIGTGEPNVIKEAKNNLSRFKNIKLIVGFAPKDLIPTLESIDKKQEIGFFIDGPKGSSKDFIPLLDYIYSKFNPCFLAIHDCESHIAKNYDKNGKYSNGHINQSRVNLVNFYEKNLTQNFSLYFMSNAWCRKYDFLNSEIYEKHKDIQPFFYKGSKQVSHSPNIALVLKK